MFSSSLQRALARGMKPGADLAKELQQLGDYSIRSKRDAKAICAALRSLPVPQFLDRQTWSLVQELTDLFNRIDGRRCPAFQVLYENGLPQLFRMFDEIVERADDDNSFFLLNVLKILALYGSREGAERIVEAARRPLFPDRYTWLTILQIIAEGHPHRDYVFDALSDPLPTEFLAVAFLDGANKAALEDDLPKHPFDSPAGWQRLQSWLEDRTPEHFSYAFSATTSLPFVSKPVRDRLLALALDHVDAGVQLRAAWAAGKLGRDAGLKMIARFCRDVNHTETALRYLEEFDREDLIPAEANDPAFRAQAEFASWLAYPTELGEPPDELEIVEARSLAWPPERELKPFWLIRYRLRDRTGLRDDDVDCGLVGSMTWCFFSYRINERPPEDIYAIHCYWEMQHAGLIEVTDDFDAAEYAGMLGKWQRGELQHPRITHVAELSPELNGPVRLVALASAALGGEEGWVVLDGDQSTWYPKSEQPDGDFDSVVLMIHVGRKLLGFRDQPNRKKYLVTNRPRREPQQIVAAYEKLAAEAEKAEPDRQEGALTGGNPLSRHFNDYVAALTAINGKTSSENYIAVYRRFLTLAESADASIRAEVYDTSNLLGLRFDDFVDALLACGRSAEVAEFVEVFASHWTNFPGNGSLGRAAFKARLWDKSEVFLLGLHDEDSFRLPIEMSMLAEIWCSRNEIGRAANLLIDCMQKLTAAFDESNYKCDRKLFAKEFQDFRSAYLRFIPSGESKLSELGLPNELR